MDQSIIEEAVKKVLANMGIAAKGAKMSMFKPKPVASAMTDVETQAPGDSSPMGMMGEEAEEAGNAADESGGDDIDPDELEAFMSKKK